jgi:hypothetical protein
VKLAATKKSDTQHLNSGLDKSEESAATRFYHISHTNLDSGGAADAHCTIFKMSQTKAWSSLKGLVHLGLAKKLQCSTTNRIYTQD